MIFFSIDQTTAPEIPLKKGFAIGIWVTIAIVSVISNVLVMHVVRANPHMRTTTNYLIVNMAVGDLLETVQSTIIVISFIEDGVQMIVKGDGILDRIMCSLQGGLFFTFMFSSIFSLVVITFDRFLAVTSPIRYKNHSSWAKYTIPVIWAVALAIPANYAINNVQLCSISGMTYCIPRQSTFDAILIVSLGFALPHAVIVVLYMVIAYKLWTRRVPGEQTQQSNAQTPAQRVARKVTRMTVSILVAFDVSWSPVFLGCVFPIMYQGFNNDSTMFYLGSKLLMISNGTINALIYAIFNENFRNAFKMTLCNNRLVSAMRNVKSKVKSNRRHSGRVSMATKEDVLTTID